MLQLGDGCVVLLLSGVDGVFEELDFSFDVRQCLFFVALMEDGQTMARSGIVSVVSSTV